MDIKIIASMFEDLKKLIKDNISNNNATAPVSHSAEISKLDSDIKELNTTLQKVASYMINRDVTISEKLENLSGEDNRRVGEVSNYLKTFIDTAHSIEERLNKPQKHNHSVV